MIESSVNDPVRAPDEPDKAAALDAARVVPPAPGSPDAARIAIRPGGGTARQQLRELWAYRELLYFLVWRDIKVRYKQTVIGAAWAIIQPFMTMVVFTIFFGRLAGLDQRTGDVPYPLFAFAALLPWQLFAFALSESANSLVNSKHLITKVYFPRLIVPLAAVLVGLVDFAVAFGVLAGMMLVYGVLPSLGVLLLPLLVLFAVAAALSVGLWLSALNVRYRDVRYTLPFLSQVWLFATPVAYPASLVPEAWRPVYGLNPMAGVVEGFRWALLGGPAPGPMIAVSAGVVVLLLWGGLRYFRKVERTVADVV
jgi:lipopolysaccharide transport system permease protein